MAGLKTLLLISEVLLLLTALAAGLTSITTLVLSKKEISGSECLLYGTFHWTGAAVEGDKAKCDFSLCAQIVVSIVALVSAIYRCLNIPFEKLDIACFRILSIIIYGLSAVFVLIESLIVHIGVAKFCDSMIENPVGPEKASSCQSNQDLFNTLTGSDANFYGDLHMATLASWISLGTWLVLTGVAILNMFFKRGDK